MQGKFRFSLDGVDATARQFADVRRQLQELAASVGKSVSRVGGRVTAVEDDFRSLTSEVDPNSGGRPNAVVVPEGGGTGVRNVFGNLVSLTPLKPVYCLYDGTLGVDCSTVSSVTNISDADEFVSVDALRQVKWKVYRMVDDLDLRFDSAQPVVGLLAEDLDNAGLGFFCEYDADGNLTGVNYPKLGVAALRLAQEAMSEVDGLKATVGELSAKIAKIEETYVKKSTVGE